MNKAFLIAEYSKYSVLFRWLIVLASVSYLFCKIYTFDSTSLVDAGFYPSFFSCVYLFIVVLLMPLNITLEALKWKVLMSKMAEVSFLNALKSVLSGFTTGFVTPNRIGEIIGRLQHVDESKKAHAAIFVLVNSLTQNIAIAVIGMPALLVFGFTDVLVGFSVKYILMAVLLLFAFFVIILFMLPRIAKFPFLKNKWSVFADLSTLKSGYILMPGLLSMIRFVVFCVQFYLLLLFFNVSISAFEGLVAIPSMYLLVTFTPALAFTEVLTRTSYAVYFIGAYTGNTSAVLGTAFTLWLINYAIPMLPGALMLLKKK